MTAPAVSLTCLIPAWNEAPRIGAVLAALATVHPAIPVLVIDDGSTDGTAEVARAHGARVLQGPGNRGKTAAVAEGLSLVQTSHVLLLDADLTGLTGDAITALVAPVAQGLAGASVSLRGNAPLLWRMIGIDYISGERVLPMALFARGALDALPRFGFEVWVNARLLSQRQRLAVVRWPGVASPSKAAKRGGFWRGLRADAAMMADIARTIGWRAMLGQIMGMRRLAA